MKTYQVFGVLLLCIGFITSCKDDEKVIVPPTAYFDVTGEVRSAADNKLVPEIIVEMRNVKIEQSGDSIFSLVATSFPKYWSPEYYISEMHPVQEDRTYLISFRDTDGALNGEFESFDTLVFFQNPVFEGADGASYLGSVVKLVNVKLKPKH
jgi:putative lipoprotein (rSAM/lipoprotein system)